MKKRIGNDISFVWHIFRKSGETQTPESFAGKEVEVKLISPLQRPATIEDVSIATGVVTFTFRGKHQVTLGNYVAVLQENRGENGMVTIDVVSAVTLVPHSYMEKDGDEGDVIEATSVELTSTISAGGGIVQQQADWAQTDDTAVDFIKNKPDMDVFCRKDMANVHTSGYDRYRHEYEQIDAETTIQSDGLLSCNYNKDGSLREMTSFIPGSITLIKDGVTLSLSYRYFANLVASIQAKADVADLASLVNTGTYNSTSKKIELKHDNNVLAEIDATAFIKDGMVDSVVVSNGYIVITFNTDAGKETIRIPVTDIFDPSNYYDKDDVDGLLADKVDKETGKGLSTNDYTDSDKEKVSSISLPGATYSISRNQWILDGNIATNSEGVLKIEATAFLTPAIVDGRLVLTRNRPNETPYFKIYSPFEGTLRISCYQWDEDEENNWGLELGYLTEYPEKYHWLDPFYYSSDNTDIAIYVKAGWNIIRGATNNVPLTIIGISLQKGILALNSVVTQRNMGLMSPGYLTQLLNKVDKVTGKGLSANDYTTADKEKLNDLPTATELTQELAGKQDTIGDLSTIRSGAQAGATAYQKPNTGIPATDLASDVQNDLAAIDGIEAVIPEQASSSNKLADKNFVNSSIATATATYRGAYNLVTDLSLTISATHAQIATALATAIQTADNNDYCYVQIPVVDATPTEFASVERYKFNGTAWEYEYTLNNSGFTAAQWAALNSGITSGLVAKLSALPTNSELTTLLNGKANKNEMSVVPGIGADADKTTITLKQGTSATVLTAHQDITGKENVMPITTATGATLSAVVGNYYRLDNVGTLAITLPTITGATKLQAITFLLGCGSSALVTFAPQGSETILYQEDFALEADTTYEVTALWNGSEWTLSRVIYE